MQRGRDNKLRNIKGIFLYLWLDWLQSEWLHVSFFPFDSLWAGETIASSPSRQPVPNQDWDLNGEIREKEENPWISSTTLKCLSLSWILLSATKQDIENLAEDKLWGDKSHKILLILHGEERRQVQWRGVHSFSHWIVSEKPVEGREGRKPLLFRINHPNITARQRAQAHWWLLSESEN